MPSRLSLSQQFDALGQLQAVQDASALRAQGLIGHLAQQLLAEDAEILSEEPHGVPRRLGQPVHCAAREAEADGLGVAEARAPLLDPRQGPAEGASVTAGISV